MTEVPRGWRIRTGLLFRESGQEELSRGVAHDFNDMLSVSSSPTEVLLPCTPRAVLRQVRQVPG